MAKIFKNKWFWIVLGILVVIGVINNAFDKGDETLSVEVLKDTTGSTVAGTEAPIGEESGFEEEQVEELESELEQEYPGYICSYDAYNCGDFSTHAEAQAVFDACGADVHKLDRDKDGIACESLP